MDIFEAVKKRHSYRDAFLNRPVSREDLTRIVQAGLCAPSGKNEQTTTFVIVDDKGLLKQIGNMHTIPAMRQAQAIIVCLMDKNPPPVYEGHSFQVEDCSAAVENMLLAITALGYATVWVDGWLRLKGRAGEIAALLNIPGEKIIKVILPVGIPQQICVQKEKKPFEQRAWFNVYGG